MMDLPLTWSPLLGFRLLERMLEVSLSQEPSSFHFCHSGQSRAGQPAGAFSCGIAGETQAKLEAMGTGKPSP